MSYQNNSQFIKEFDNLGVSKYDERVYKYKEIQVQGYADLLCKIKNALKVVSIAAINELNNENISIEISDTLELISELIPIDEGRLLDKLHNEAITKKIKAK